MQAFPVPDISGTWVIFGPGSLNPTCSFTQTGIFFCGPCEGPGSKGAAFGMLDGEMFRWSYQWTSKRDGSMGAFEFGGKLGDDGVITGQMIGTTGIKGAFYARRMTSQLAAANKSN